MAKQRIQKVLSEAGVASRRGVEEMIIEGRLTVNRKLVVELPCFVDPEVDEIRLDGRAIRLSSGQKVHLLLNKPTGVLCTQQDAQGRPVVRDLVPEMHGRVYCTGGLDEPSTGLVLLTNDGELTRRLTHRGTALEMTYTAEVDGLPNSETFLALRNGIFIEGNRTRPMGARFLYRSPRQSTLEIVTDEARGQMIRRVLYRLGHKVRRLSRTGFGPLADRGLKTGFWRALTDNEVRQLHAVLEGGSPAKRPKEKKPRPRR